MLIKFALLVCIVALQAHAKVEVESMQFDTADLKQVDIKNRTGLIRVTALPAGEAVKGSVIAKKNQFAPTCRLTMEKAGARLVVLVKQGGFINSDDCKVDFDIRAPKTVQLNLKQGTGNIEINGITGELSFKIGSGRVFADGHFPKVTGESGSGNVRLNGLAGPAILKSGSGNYELLIAKDAVRGNLDISVASGNALVQFPKGAKIKTQLKSVSGKVFNELGESTTPDFNVTMKAASGNLTINGY